MSTRRHLHDAEPVGGRDAGFTLPDVVMTTIIMLVIAMGVITALTYAARTTSVSAARTMALNLASQ